MSMIFWWVALFTKRYSTLGGWNKTFYQTYINYQILLRFLIWYSRNDSMIVLQSIYPLKHYV